MSSAISFMQIVVSLCAVFMLLKILYVNIKKNEYVSCLNLFSIFSIVDIFLPSILGAVTGKYQFFPYFRIRSSYTYFKATILFLIFIILFYFGWKVRIRVKTYKKTVAYSYKISELWLFVFYWTAVLIYFLNLYIEYRTCGSFELFYQYKITRAYLITIQYNSILERIVSVASEFSTTIMFITTSIGFVNANYLKKKKFWKYIAPLFSFFIVVSTLYRGTILNYACMILISIQFKYYNNKKIILSNKTKRTIKKLIGIAGICFVIYGGYRTMLNNKRWEIDTSFIESVSQMLSNTLGTTLVACARCIDFLTVKKKIFWGKSIFEMFSFFVPRQLWKSKPTSYGIITLTTAMGSPSTTMDAISIPGELLLNFDIWGILLIPFIGYIFKKYEKLKEHNRFKYIYASTVCALVTTSMWMSFTGFFSQIKYFPIYMCVCVMILKKQRR